MDQPQDAAALPATATVAVAGTGTMGQGIAQVAAAAGHPVLLYDAAPGRAAEAVAAVGKRLDRLAEKGRLTAERAAAARAALRAVETPDGLAGAALVVEAIAEDPAAKRTLFAALEDVVADDCVLATNTSSLSVTAVAGALRLPGRLVGMHFFNPPPLMPLVEVVSGHATDPHAAGVAHATAAAWGKTPVRCADTPGFVVNRVARPFYAEAFRLLEEGTADPATLDAVLREGGGFRMGPFELTDLIGQDVNEAVTRSVWEAFFHDPKFTPSLAQRRLVESGRLGRKSGRGWYAHAEGAPAPQPLTAGPQDPPERVTVTGGTDDPGLVALVTRVLGEDRVAAEPAPAGTTEPRGCLVLPAGARLLPADGGYAAAHGPGAVQYDLVLDWETCGRVALAAAQGTAPEALAEAVGLFQALGKRVTVLRDTPGMVVARTVAMLADLAADAADRAVASADGIDTAMRLGVNYPLGPLEWMRRLGEDRVRALLTALHATSPSGRYWPCPALLRRGTRAGDVISS
jgi:3-hydroxybutyryl-CoA dehydrogenase